MKDGASKDSGSVGADAADAGIDSSVPAEASIDSAAPQDATPEASMASDASDASIDSAVDVDADMLDGGADAEPFGDSGDADSGPGAVTGTLVNTYYGEDNVPVKQPMSLQGFAVNAYVWSGSAWVTYAGSGDASGSFTIPNVPLGDFMLDVGGLLVFSSARVLDLGRELSGRPSGTLAFGASVAGTVANLDPWQSFDALQWYCPNAAGSAANPSPTPAVGATSLTQSEVAPWAGSLVDSTQGDVLYLTQLSYGTVGTTAASLTLTRFGAFPNETMTNGATLSASGPLSMVSANASTSISLKASQFAPLAGQVNPSAISNGAAFTVLTAPGAGAAGVFGDAASLYELYAGNTDIDLGSAAFANPFSAAWGIVDYVGANFIVKYTASGATSPYSANGSVFQTFLPPAGTPTVTPALSPVQSPSIGGQPLTSVQTGVGLTPTIGWSAPTTGTPNAYHVIVFALASSGGATTFTQQAEIVTTTTSVVLPPGLLTSGGQYVLEISAVASPIDASTQPFRLSPTWAQADFLSAIMTP
jgi:hypothetical protein